LVDELGSWRLQWRGPGSARTQRAEPFLGGIARRASPVSACPATPAAPTPIGPAAIDPAAIGPAAIGPAAIGPAAIGPAAIGPAAIGPAEGQRGEEDNADAQPANGDELAHSRDSWLAVLRLQAQGFADEDHQQPGDEQYRADDGQAHGETQPSRSHRA
jgi:hypothetical protein